MHPFTKRKAEAVGALGESKLILSIRNWLGTTNPPAPFGIGDDCAVLPRPRGIQVVTVDPVIFGRHFDANASGRAVGAKLLKRNLSDVASMGARPTFAVVSLVLDRGVRTEWLRQFYLGIADAARRYGVAVVGGDVAQADGSLTASLTLLGEAGETRVLTRNGAKIGERIYVTGELGGSILGHHLRFEPRLTEGAWLAKQKAVTAMMDVSDGLAKDLWSLMPANGFPALRAEAVPISAAAKRLARKTGRPSLYHALSDGEDYELAFTLAQQADASRFERAWSKTFRTRLSCIGGIIHEAKRSVGSFDLNSVRGYEHLR
jgi:thiamine-monophosphate kinase